jgi:hypothetical protein
MRRKLLKRAFLAAVVPLVFLSFVFLVGGCPAPGGGKDPDDPGPDEPVLAVTPSALDFDSSTNVRSIEVKNIGDGTLEWWVCDEESCGFADCEPCGETGLLPGQTITVLVSVDRPSLPKPPIGSIKIESNGGECVLTLSVAVDTSILLRGVVKEGGSGKPIAGADVTAEWQEGTPPATVTRTCRSGDAGGYSVSVESSTLTISAEMTGYQPYTTEEGTKFTVNPPDPDDPKPHIVYDIEMTRD